MSEGLPSLEKLASEKATGRLHKPYNTMQARPLVFVCACEQETSKLAYKLRMKTILHHLNITTCGHGILRVRIENARPVPGQRGPGTIEADWYIFSGRLKGGRETRALPRIDSVLPQPIPFFPPLLSSFFSLPFPDSAFHLSSLTLLFMIYIKERKADFMTIG